MSPRVAVLLTCLAVSLHLGCNKSSTSSSGETTGGSGGVASATTAPNATAPAQPATAATPSPTPNANAKVYGTRGVIKAFGADRKSVKIAHEDVPGYMKAMTMPFAVSSPNVLDGLKDGDAVDFTFTEESDGRLLIQTIKKR